VTKSPEQPDTQPELPAETPPIRLFGLKDAAVYCGLAARTLKYHIYESGELKPDAIVGHSVVFTQPTLDAFLRNRRAPGRPKGSKSKSTKDEA
jgi:hypothetical protein